MCVTIVGMERKYHKEIRIARKEKGWTQKDLAVELGTTQQNVGRWEKGTMPSIKWRNSLKRVLGVNFEEDDMGIEAGDLVCRPLRSLPLMSLNEYDFENFMADILSHMGEDYIVYGVRGDKQDGLDVVPVNGVETVVQCKRVRKFGEAEARAIVDEYNKGEVIAKRKILAITVRPAVRAIRLLKKTGWEIWTPDVITRKVRYELTDNRKRGLVKDYFSDIDIVLRECLGLESDSCFVEILRHFENIKDGLIEYDNTYQPIAGDLLSEMADYLNDDVSRVIVLSGVGGVGKTRRLKEVAKLVDREMLLLKDSQDYSGKDLAKALRNKSIVVIDDAHKVPGSMFNGVLTEYVEQKINGKKMVVTTRKHAKEYVLEVIRKSGISEDAIVEYDIDPLKDKDAFCLASSIIGEDNAFLGQLVKVSGGNALLITMGGKLLNERGAIPAKLLNEGDGKRFIRSIFKTYLDEGFISEKEKSVAQLMMGVLSVIQPCTSRQLFEISQRMFGDNYSNVEIRRVIGKLIEFGLIREANNKVWVSPDLLADYECEAMLLNDGRDNGTLDEILDSLLGGNIDLFCNILQNVCQLDWRMKMLDGSKLLKRKLWARFQEMILRADTGSRMELVDTLREVAYFSPDDALATVDLIIKNPATVESKRYDGETITNDAVEDKIAKVLLPISYNEEYLRTVLDEIVEIAKMRRINGSRCKDFLDAIKEIARYEIYKPVTYTEQVIEYVLDRGFEIDFPFEAYDILEECLKTSGSSMLPRGKISMEIRQFKVKLKAVQEFRRKIIKRMIKDINGNNKKLAILAAGLIQTSLNVVDDDEWKTERIWILKQFYNDLKYDKLSPVLAAIVRAKLNFMLSDTVEARDIVRKIPVSLDNELARSIVDAWGHSTFYGDGYEISHARYTEWLKSLAIKLVEAYSCSEIVDKACGFLVDLRYHSSNVGEEYAANIFRALSDASETFCVDFINTIIDEKKFEGLIGNSLISLVVVHGRVEEAMRVTKNVLTMDSAIILQSVAQFLIISIDVLPLEWVANVFKVLLKNEDVTVRQGAIGALRLLPKQYYNLAAGLVNAIDIAPGDQELLCAIEEILNPEYGAMDVRELSKGMRQKIKEALIYRSDLGYAEIGFIQSVVGDYPREVIDLMIERCKKYDECDGDRWSERYSPVPYSGALKVEENILRMAISAIITNSSKLTDSIHFFGTRLVRFFGGNQEEMIKCVLDILPKIDDAGIAKMLLKALPLTVLWDKDIIDRIVVSVIDKMPSGVLVDSLFGLIFDDSGGAHARTIGVPGSFEMSLKDNSEKMLEKCDDVMLKSLYLKIHKYATYELERQRKDDEDLMRV